jgi:hypothetical protein
VAFLIHFSSLGATLVPFEHWEAILQMASSLGGFFYIFSIVILHMSSMPN